VTDIDGTLTDRDRRLDPGAVTLLRRLERRGVPVILATGNVLPIALGVHRSVGLSGPIVAENGGLVYSQVGGRDVVERLADRSLAWAAYVKLRRAGIPVRRLFTDRWRETEIGLEPTVSESALRRVLRGDPVDVEGTGFAIHLMERGHGKVVGLRHALRPLGLTLQECVVAGDGDNDVAMLRGAGHAVSFVGASARARAAADYVARRPNARGFVEAVKRSPVLARRST
jgi:hypothetical protein